MNTFSHAGVSSLNGEFKVRFANDALRTKVLVKNGHKNIDIVELKNPMTKEDAVAYLLSIDFDNGNKAVRAALEEAAGKRGLTPKAASKDKPKKEAKKPKKAPTKVAATAKAPVQTQAQAFAAIEAEVGEALS
jgi:hypothetical protein